MPELITVTLQWEGLDSTRWGESSCTAYLEAARRFYCSGTALQKNKGIPVKEKNISGTLKFLEVYTLSAAKVSNHAYLGYDLKILKLITQCNKILSSKNTTKVIKAHIEIAWIISNDGKFLLYDPCFSVPCLLRDQISNLKKLSELSYTKRKICSSNLCLKCYFNIFKSITSDLFVYRNPSSKLFRYPYISQQKHSITTIYASNIFDSTNLLRRIVSETKGVCKIS